MLQKRKRNTEMRFTTIPQVHHSAEGLRLTATLPTTCRKCVALITKRQMFTNTAAEGFWINHRLSSPLPADLHIIVYHIMYIYYFAFCTQWIRIYYIIYCTKAILKFVYASVSVVYAVRMGEPCQLEIALKIQSTITRYTHILWEYKCIWILNII